MGISAAAILMAAILAIGIYVWLFGTSGVDEEDVL